MHPDQTAPTGAVRSGSTLFVNEASNILVDDKNIHFVIMRFKGNFGYCLRASFLRRETGKVVSAPVFRPFSNSHQYRYHIRLCQVDIISAFSGQNKVTKCVRNIYCPVIINDRLSTKY